MAGKRPILIDIVKGNVTPCGERRVIDSSVYEARSTLLNVVLQEGEHLGPGHKHICGYVVSAVLISVDGVGILLEGKFTGNVVAAPDASPEGGEGLVIHRLVGRTVKH